MPKRVLTAVNVALAVLVVAVLLGCGGDSAIPPPGSTEEKLRGEWEADPMLGRNNMNQVSRSLEIWYSEGNGEGGGPGLVANYREWSPPVEAGTPPKALVFHEQFRLAVKGLTATVVPHPNDDGSNWEFRLDTDQPDVLYATWTLKGGTKLLDGLKFRKTR